MYTYYGETSPSESAFRLKRNIKNELSLNEKLSMVWAVADCGRFKDLRFYKNNKEFFDALFWENTIGAVCASCRGTYNPHDPYVKINALGEVESYSAEYVEQKIDNELDEIVAAFADYLKAGKTRDWYGRFEKVDEE